MRSSILAAAAAALAASHFVSAQTFTSCNPTEKTCPADTALGKTITVDFTQGKSSYFTEATGTSLTYDSTNGANFIMDAEGVAPTITSNFYIFFGKVSVTMQAAPGVGIVSSFVMESDDLDEIDWEWLGGDTTQVESNYFGKGNTTTYDRAIYHPVSTPQTTMHTYTIDWSKESIIWSIDGTEVRTLLYTDAVDGKNFPQTPMVVKMGNWDGGASSESAGTIEWAGGLTDWTKAPFTMYVKSVTIEDASSGATSYTYGDLTGDYESIDISTAAVSSGSSATATASSAASASSVAPASSVASAHLVSSSASSAIASVASSGSTKDSTSSGSTPSSTSNVSPSFQDPAPVSNTTSSNLTSSAKPTGSSTTKSSSSSSASSASVSLSTTSDGESKYGKIDVAVLVLGLTVGYFFM